MASSNPQAATTSTSQPASTPTMPPPAPPRTPADSKIFTHHWSASMASTFPSLPSLRITRTTPADFPARLAIISNPLNLEFMDSRTKVWDAATIAAWETRQRGRYDDSRAKFACIDAIVELDGKVVGLCDMTVVDGGLLNVGLILNPEGRGRGAGTAVIGGMMRIAMDTGMGAVGSGTMKANKGLQGVMRKLGIEGKEEDVVIPGRGLVAELLYIVQPGEWKDPVEVAVEFGEVLEDV